MAKAYGIPLSFRVPATRFYLTSKSFRITVLILVPRSLQSEALFQPRASTTTGGMLTSMARKAKSQPAAAQWNQRSKLIEEFASLDQEVDNFKPKLFRHGKLRELILSWYPGAAPEEEITVPGVNCDILISARDQIRAVTSEGKQKLYRLWGSREFIARSRILLSSLPDPKDENGLYTVQALTGPRHLRVTSKARAAATDTAA